jgi:hypothetical protein
MGYLVAMDVEQLLVSFGIPLGALLAAGVVFVLHFAGQLLLAVGRFGYGLFAACARQPKTLGSSSEVVLYGRLEIGGSPATWWKDERPVAAASAHLARWRFGSPAAQAVCAERAEVLMLRLKQGESLPIDGKVVVERGTHEWVSRRSLERLNDELRVRVLADLDPSAASNDSNLLLTSHYPTLRAIVPGATVAVRATLESSVVSVDDGTNQQPTTSRRLSAAQRPITIRAAGWALRLSDLRLTRMALAAMGAFALIGGIAGHELSFRLTIAGMSCNQSEPCTERGICARELALAPHWPGFDIHCTADSPTQCRQSKRCREFGECSLDQSRCVAKNAGDCPAERCQALGACGVHLGKCEATVDEHCERSTRCKSDGACAVRDGVCVPTLQGCQRLTNCIEYGWCEPAADRCIASQRGCKASSGCRVHGKCSLVGYECKSATNADCAGSVECRNLGRCSHEAGGCAALKHADCRKSRACKLGGACYAAIGVCSLVPAKCLAKVVSEQLGDTEPYDQVIKLLSYRPNDPDEGFVWPLGPECLKLAAQSCQSSLNCRRLGRCGFDTDLVMGSCMPMEDQDCEESELCKRDGKCSLHQHECVREEPPEPAASSSPSP